MRLQVILKGPLHAKFFLLTQNPVPYYTLFEPDPKPYRVWDDITNTQKNSVPSVHNSIYVSL